MLLPAVCPHCHDAELQIPAELSGTDVVCRRCGKKFLFQPVTKSVFDSDPPRGRKAKAAAPESSTDQPDYALWFVLAGVGLFGPAIIATQFAYGRIAAVVLLVLGMLLAAVGLLGLEAKRWAGWLTLGANAAGVLVVSLFPGLLGATTWLPQKPETTEFKVPTAVTRDGPARPVQWVEAGSAVWEMGDTRVAVAAAAVEPPTKPKAGTPPTADTDKTPTLRITIQLTNVGLARSIDFPGWFIPPPAVPPPGSPPPPAPKLTADGKAVPPKANPAAAVRPVPPGKSVETALLFALPQYRDELRLELPPEPFGGTEPVRFRVPWSMVARGQFVPTKPTTP